MFMYIVCVYFVAFCFSVILAVSCSSSKQKKRKKNIVALTQYSRARIFPHTHFSTSKNFKCRTKIFTFRRIKNSLSLLAGASRHPCHLSRVPLSLLPAKNLCLSQAFRLASNRNTLPESKGKRTVPFSVIPKILSLFPPHGGGHRSSQVGTHVRRCPRLRLLRIR